MKPNAITQCQTKKSYQTQQEADDVSTYLWYKKEIDVYSYKCPMCENFHLSSKK